jgi:hypothetical protein
MQPMGLSRRLALALVGLGLAASVAAATLEGLYDGVVPGDVASSDHQTLATDALKQVVVRLTGRRAAAQDPVLSSLYSDALRLAGTYRSVPPGQVAVGFDAAALDTALLAAGQRLWGRERPATLVVVVPQRASAPTLMGADVALRREVEQVARERGLPLVWPTGVEGAVLQQRYSDVLAGRLESLQALARQFGAAAVLVGRTQGASGNWSWQGPAGEGAFAGPGGEAVHALADRYAALFASSKASPGGTLAVAVRGVRDLAGYAAASQLLAAVDGVRGVSLEMASGDALRFRIGYSGDAGSFRQAAVGGRLVPDDGAAEDGAVHFVLRP